LLRIENVTTASGVRAASLNVHRGEIVGVAGLVGSGKSELLRAAFGLDRVTAGRVMFKGRDITHSRPHRLLDSGMFYLPPDRKLEGLVLPFSSRDNVALSALAKRVKGAFGLLSYNARDLRVARAAKAVDLAERSVGRTVGLLSGGNQQKVLFAKGLALDVDLYVLDEPTVGVDVGTRSSLYSLVKRLCESGAGVVVISSDLPEVLNLAHRLYVMRRGEVAGELLGNDIEESRVLNLFFDRDAKAAWSSSASSGRTFDTRRAASQDFVSAVGGAACAARARDPHLRDHRRSVPDAAEPDQHVAPIGVSDPGVAWADAGARDRRSRPVGRYDPGNHVGGRSDRNGGPLRGAPRRGLDGRRRRLSVRPARGRHCRAG
jgi:ABC-type multidrug transport system ATPase subunit